MHIVTDNRNSDRATRIFAHELHGEVLLLAGWIEEEKRQRTKSIMKIIRLKMTRRKIDKLGGMAHDRRTG